MEGRNGKLAITAGLVGLIVAASIAMALGHTSPPPAMVDPAPPPAVTADKLSAELDRCNRLGPNDKPDQGCLDAWAEARRHFMGGRP
jgi:conjugative transfer region protein TrbK